jgi:hypothetical protein
LSVVCFGQKVGSEGEADPDGGAGVVLILDLGFGESGAVAEAKPSTT